jgi:hypothetical protein
MTTIGIPPQEPQLRDFELTEEKYSAIKEQLSNLSLASLRAGSLLFILILGGGFFICVKVKIGIGLLAILLPASLIMGFLSAAYYEYARKPGIKGLDRLMAYEKATSDYKWDLEEYRRWIWQDKEKLEFWRFLSGREFEEELAELFRHLGWKSTVTAHSDDKGIDIIVELEDGTAVVQCKAWNKPAGPAIVRELYGAMQAAEVDIAILACTGGFTKGVYEFAKDKTIYLLRIEDIVGLQKRAAGEEYETGGSLPLKGISSFQSKNLGSHTSAHK